MKKPQPPKGTVYLLHLDKSISRSSHYLGWASSLEERIKQHGTSAGAKFTFAAAQRGIGFQVVRTWENATRQVERSLKCKKDSRSLCPFCKADRAESKRFYNAMKKLRVKRISWN
jgi:predicted GIY-YIG superfamily endonuclease